MAKSEKELPYFSVLQALAGALMVLLLTTPCLFWMVAAYRVERVPELVQMLNNLGWIMWATPIAPFALQVFAICMCGLQDKRERPFMLRWACYMGLWVVVGTLPAALVPFYTSGPFAWNGLFSFWVPLIAPGIWVTSIITAALVRYITTKPGNKVACEQ